MAVLAGDDGLIRCIVLREAAGFAVPAKLFTGESGRFYREKAGLSDPPSDRERGPEVLFLSETVIRPIFPVIMWLDFRKRFVLHFLSFAEDAEPAIGL